MKTKAIILVILAILFSIPLQSQVVIPRRNVSLAINSQAKKHKPIKTKIRKGQTKNLSFYVFENNTYVFDLDVPAKLERVNFLLINQAGEVIFDNAIADFCTSAVLYAESNQKITLQIITQPPKFFETKKKSYELGVKLSYSKSTAS